jgi:hypothetical protein
MTLFADIKSEVDALREEIAPKPPVRFIAVSDEAEAERVKASLPDDASVVVVITGVPRP